ncbi:nuclear transport factor 2 family protein [Streptomyces flavofungini]|uniref:nuclear transport factor 2 family protein n=1 Tax=Streptomyces flavofungini TaxID=68200 RepID=UPI0025AEFA82|nr:nuclear transport factor 2 family protein [Streptomyces flavofungini]WJV50621.1 nuclear transport factor 2 family protein [Streptomyces flavofungini]
MSRTPQQIFESYVHAGAMSRNAVALAENFTPDGVLELPLMPDDVPFPRRMVGREEIRGVMAAYYERQAQDQRAPNLEKSGFVLHTTADPDVFIAEIDTVFDGGGEGDGGADGGGKDVTVSLVQIFRVRDGKIARLRDYFAPDLMS